MTITNHVLAGAIIGLAVTEPVAAIILAIASHFFMDALPHFGYAGKKGYGEALKYRLSYVVAIVTLLTTLAAIALLAIHGKWFAIFIGLIAASPDVVGLYNWLAYEKKGKSASGLLRLIHVRFHRAIQWCERPGGVAIECIVFVGLSFSLTHLL